MPESHLSRAVTFDTITSYRHTCRVRFPTRLDGGVHDRDVYPYRCNVSWLFENGIIPSRWLCNRWEWLVKIGRPGAWGEVGWVLVLQPVTKPSVRFPEPLDNTRPGGFCCGV